MPPPKLGNATDTQSKLINIAKLHNATTAKLNQLHTIFDLLDCVSNVVNPDTSMFASANKALCDDRVTDMIVKHELGNNQTMIKVA